MAEQARDLLEDTERGLDDLYLDKLRQRVATFSDPVNRKTSEGSYVAGVAYAKIGDFGMGHDSLIVVYLAHTMPDAVPIEDVASSYQMEIWDAGSGSELNRVYTGRLCACDQGNVLVDVRLISIDGRKWIGQRNRSDDGKYETVYFELDAKGGYGKVDEPSGAYRADQVRVPVVARDVSGYGLELGLSQSDSALWRLGIDKPAAGMVESPIQSGWYSATLPVDGLNPVYSGFGYVAKAALDDGALRASGTFRHVDRYDDLFKRGHEPDIVGPTEWVFTLSDTVEFQLRGEANGPRVVDASRFSEALGYHGLNLGIEVVDGLVVLAAVSS